MDIQNTQSKRMSILINKICLIIPVLNPDTQLLDILTELTKCQPINIIVINDGSNPNSNAILKKIVLFPKIVLLNHDSNQGKGAALKTGFLYYLDNFKKDHIGVVCLDGDGQHLPENVLHIASRLQATAKTTLILGARNFKETIPFRSKFGNQTIRLLFRLFHNINLSDTQTGLRGIPTELVKLFIQIPWNHYEFESACLIESQRHGIPIEEVKITTVYRGNNESSHFLPIQDSYKIFKIILSRNNG